MQAEVANKYREGHGIEMNVDAHVDAIKKDVQNRRSTFLTYVPIQNLFLVRGVEAHFCAFAPGDFNVFVSSNCMRILSVQACGAITD